MQDVENGASVDLGNVPALDWSLMKLMKGLIEKHRQKKIEKEAGNLG